MPKSRQGQADAGLNANLTRKNCIHGDKERIEPLQIEEIRDGQVLQAESDEVPRTAVTLLLAVFQDVQWESVSAADNGAVGVQQASPFVKQGAWEMLVGAVGSPPDGDLLRILG